ncbi:hypothetical protein HDU92_008074 [Lobulomyces angularis]|nr:hypothetical protein HDU92_008074 [Lobulomyces angularis]
MLNESPKKVAPKGRGRPATGVNSTKKTDAGTKSKSPYNLFLKTEIPRVKEQDPSLTHKAAFKLAAKNWGSSDQNPKNK